MKKYKVYHTKIMDDKLSKLHKELVSRINKIEDHLMENPYVGKPLGVKWLREKKLNKHRVYYIIYEGFSTVYIINMSEKKDQQIVINTIKALLDEYKEEIEKLVSN